MWDFILLAVIVIGVIWYLKKKVNKGLEKSLINDFFETNVTDNPEKLFHTKIAGVTKKNKNGSDRQQLIEKYLSRGEYLLLKREKDNNHDENATAVL